MKKIWKFIIVIVLIIMVVTTIGMIYIRPQIETGHCLDLEVSQLNSSIVEQQEEIPEKKAEMEENIIAEPEMEEVKTPDPSKSEADIANEVIAGKWGNGAERASRLAAAGYDYENIQAIVEEMLELKKSLTPTPEKRETTTKAATPTPKPEATLSETSAGRIVVPSTGTNAVIKSATFTPYNVQKVIDQGYAAYYSDYASNGSRKVYGGHNYSAFKGLSGVAVGASVWVDGKEYHVTKKVTGGIDDWDPIFDNTGIILQTCSGKGYNVYVICN